MGISGTKLQSILIILSLVIVLCTNPVFTFLKSIFVHVSTKDVSDFFFKKKAVKDIKDGKI